MQIKICWIISLLIILSSYPVTAQMQKLKIADSHRFLVREDGSAFVWIGETNWFFAQLPPETIDRILEIRSKQGFTIMFVSCRQNLYNGGGTGEINHPNEHWWSYLDEYIAKCEKRNLYVGITLGWWGKAMSNSKEDLYRHGKWVGNRYKDNHNIIWLTLGEAGGHLRETTIPDEKLDALIKGIREGDTGNKLLTVHADYRRGTSLCNDGDISDFNNWQTSQWCCLNDLPRKDDRNWTVWEAITYDYNKLYDGKPKPTLDSEAWYENNKDFCGAGSYNIRRRAYYTIFAGAFGHTYGAGGLWDGLVTGDSCSSSALEALEYPGAEDIGHLSSLLHGLGEDFLKLRPDQGMIEKGNSSSYDTHIQATMAIDRSFVLLYSGSDAPYSVNTRKFSSSLALSAIWFNPREGVLYPCQKSGTDVSGDSMEFDPPGSEGPGNDWVLILGSLPFMDVLKCKLE